MKDKVTLIVPSHNEEKNIMRCLDSIKRQIYDNWECLVICNGCTDRTYEIATMFSDIDSRFIVYDFEWGCVSRARNFGIENANGEWIMFIDADDYVLPEHVSNIVKIAKETGEQLVRGKMNIVMPENMVVWGVSKIGKINVNDNILLSNRKEDIGHCHPFLYNRKLLEDIRFNENIKRCEDTLFNIEVTLKNGGLYNTNSTTYVYCLYNTSLSRTPLDRERITNHYEKLEQKYGENKTFKNFIKSL